MRDDKFWSIANTYEIVKGGVVIVPKKNIEALSEELIRENKGNYYESLMDFKLFNFENYEMAENMFNNVFNRLKEEKRGK